MVHFAFLACNTLTLNTKKYSFFQWFLYTFPKMVFLTKVVFQFECEGSNKSHQYVSIKNHVKNHKKHYLNIYLPADLPLIHLRFANLRCTIY